MNVMAQAHKATKLLIQSMSAEGQAQVKAEKLYGRMFAINLKRFHKEYKAECEASPVEWYSITGHVICPDTNIYIPVGEGTSNVEKAADSVLWYIENFDKHCITLTASRQNGSVFVERPNTNYK